MRRAARLAIVLTLAIAAGGCGGQDLAGRNPIAISGDRTDTPTPDAPPPPPPASSDGTQLPTDLRPCPGINPDIRRPAGSNCLGILPTACQGDRIADIVGSADTPALREHVARVVAHPNIRWIGFGEAVIQNLDPTRLNIELDGGGRVMAVDCY